MSFTAHDEAPHHLFVEDSTQRVLFPSVPHPPSQSCCGSGRIFSSSMLSPPLPCGGGGHGVRLIAAADTGTAGLVVVPPICWFAAAHALLELCQHVLLGWVHSAVSRKIFHEIPPFSKGGSSLVY